MKDQSSKRPLSVSKSENVLQGWYTAEMSNVSREDGEETDFSVTITNEAMAPSLQTFQLLLCVLTRQEVGVTEFAFADYTSTCIRVHCPATQHTA